MKLLVVASDGSIGFDESGACFHRLTFDTIVFEKTLKVLAGLGIHRCAVIDDHGSGDGDFVLPARPTLRRNQ